MSRCTDCGADWSRDKFGAECAQCGGGAMERACPICEGRCGRTWKRAVSDSQDSGEAHWLGGCGLPGEEQMALMIEAHDAEKVDRAVQALKSGDLQQSEDLLRQVIDNAPKEYQHMYEEFGELFIKFWDMQQFIHYVAWNRDHAWQDHGGRGRGGKIFWAKCAYPKAYYYLGFLMVSTRRPARAIDFLDRGQELEPSNPKFDLEKAQAHIQLGNFQKALDLFDAVNAVGPHVCASDVARSLRGRGFVLIEMGELEAAEEAFRRSLKLEPENQLAQDELKYIDKLRGGG